MNIKIITKSIILAAISATFVLLVDLCGAGQQEDFVRRTQVRCDDIKSFKEVVSKMIDYEKKGYETFVVFKSHDGTWCLNGSKEDK